MDESSIVCKGWLEWKRRKGVSLRYKNYWFVLRRKDPSLKTCQLECYSDNLSMSKKPNEVTKLDLALAVGKRQARDKPFAFEILFSGKKEQYAAHSSDDRDKWIAALKKVKITQVGEVGDEFDVVMVPTEASQKLESSMRRHDLANHPITMRITSTHLTLGKQDSDSVIVSWSLSHLGPISHSAGISGQQDQGVVTVKVNDSGSHNGTYQFRTQQYREVTRAVHNKLQGLMVRLGSSPTEDGRKHAESPTRPLTPQLVRRSLSPPSRTPDVPPRMEMYQTVQKSVKGSSTMPRLTGRGRPALPIGFSCHGEDSDEDAPYIHDIDVNVPLKDDESDEDCDYIRDDDINPVFTEVAGQAPVLESDEDKDQDPYLQLVDGEEASDNPYLELENSDPCPKLKSDAHGKAGNKTKASSCEVKDDDDDEANSHMYFSVDENGVPQLEEVGAYSPRPAINKSNCNIKLNRHNTVAAEGAEMNIKDPLTQIRNKDFQSQNPSTLARYPPPIPNREGKPGSPRQRVPPYTGTRPNTLPRLAGQQPPPLPDRLPYGHLVTSPQTTPDTFPRQEQLPPPPLPNRNDMTGNSARRLSSDHFMASPPATPDKVRQKEHKPSPLPHRMSMEAAKSDQFVKSPPPLPPRRDSDNLTVAPPPLPKRSASCCDSFSFSIESLELENTHTTSFSSGPPPLPVRREGSTSVELPRRSSQPKNRDPLVSPLPTRPSLPERNPLAVELAPPAPSSTSASPIFPRVSGTRPPLPERRDDKPPMSQSLKRQIFLRQERLSDTEDDYFTIEDNEIASYVEI